MNLIWVKSIIVDNNIKHEVSRYIGKDKIRTLGYEISKILLAYKCDFLAGAFSFIKGDCYLKFLAELQIESLNTNCRAIYVVEINENNTTLL
jgi:hypothetical protein